MDIEELNKSQIVLLTLLVSFVTSIATGIVTVSLMQQAPPAITQTVNRVVEHTVEKIVPGQTAVASQPVTQTIQTVVVKEGDTIAAAVSAVTPSIVRVYSVGEVPRLLGLGIVLDTSGVVAMDASSLGDAADAMVDIGAGVQVRGFVQRRDQASGVAYLATATSTPDGTAVPVWKPIALSAQHPVLGQTVVALAGKTTIRLAQGIVAAAQTLGDSPTAQIIETNIAESSVMQGSALIDTSGALIGLSTGVSRAVGAADFVSADVLTMKESDAGQQ